MAARETDHKAHLEARQQAAVEAEGWREAALAWEMSMEQQQAEMEGLHRQNAELRRAVQELGWRLEAEARARLSADELQRGGSWHADNLHAQHVTQSSQLERLERLRQSHLVKLSQHEPGGGGTPGAQLSDRAEEGLGSGLRLGLGLGLAEEGVGSGRGKGVGDGTGLGDGTSSDWLGSLGSWLGSWVANAESVAEDGSVPGRRRVAEGCDDQGTLSSPQPQPARLRASSPSTQEAARRRAAPLLRESVHEPSSLNAPSRKPSPLSANSAERRGEERGGGDAPRQNRPLLTALRLTSALAACEAQLGKTMEAEADGGRC